MKIFFLIITLITASDLFSQTRLHPYIGIHLPGDAELYYIGPSFQVGTDYYLKKRLLLSGYGHYYAKIVDRLNRDNSFEKGKFKTITGCILLQFNVSRNLNRSFFFAGGMSIQRWADNFKSSWNVWDIKRTTVLPAVRLGYFFPVYRFKLALELNGTGPYSYHEDNSDMLEILTQISVGLRLIL